MYEWISVDFAVPPDEREVLVRTFYKWQMANGKETSHSDIYIACRIVFKNGKVKWRGDRGYVATDETETKVTHWMSLPEQPKE